MSGVKRIRLNANVDIVGVGNNSGIDKDLMLTNKNDVTEENLLSDYLDPTISDTANLGVISAFNYSKTARDQETTDRKDEIERLDSSITIIQNNFDKVKDILIDLLDNDSRLPNIDQVVSTNVEISFNNSLSGNDISITDDGNEIYTIVKSTSTDIHGCQGVETIDILNGDTFSIEFEIVSISGNNLWIGLVEDGKWTDFENNRISEYEHIIYNSSNQKIAGSSAVELIVLNNNVGDVLPYDTNISISSGDKIKMDYDSNGLRYNYSNDGGTSYSAMHDNYITLPTSKDWRFGIQDGNNESSSFTVKVSGIIKRG